MKVTIELSKKEIKVIKERQVFRMDWIKTGMDKKEPMDFILQKILNASQQTDAKCPLAQSEYDEKNCLRCIHEKVCYVAI